jgi:hypothetical protein
MTEPFDLADIAEFLPTGAVARLLSEATLHIASPDWQVAVEWPCEPDHAIGQAWQQQSAFEQRVEQRAQSKAHKAKVKEIGQKHKAKKEKAIRDAIAGHKAKKEKK